MACDCPVKEAALLMEIEYSIESSLDIQDYSTGIEEVESARCFTYTKPYDSSVLESLA